jgi:predicted CopG family antitoxin
MEACEALSREKLPGESFSQVIKRVFKARGFTASSLLKATESITLSDRTLDRIEHAMSTAKRNIIATPKL